MNRARTLGIHFGNNRFRWNYCRTSGNSSESLAAIAFGGERRDLDRNPECFPVGRHFGGHRRANFAPPSRHSVVSSVALPTVPPSRALTPLAPPALVLALLAPPRPRCPLHGDSPCPPLPPSMVASQWLSLGIEPLSLIRYPTPTLSPEWAAHSPPPRRPSPPTIMARMSALTQLPAYFIDPALAAPPPPPPPTPPPRLCRTWIIAPHGPSTKGCTPLA